MLQLNKNMKENEQQQKYRGYTVPLCCSVTNFLSFFVVHFWYLVCCTTPTRKTQNDSISLDFQKEAVEKNQQSPLNTKEVDPLHSLALSHFSSACGVHVYRFDTIESCGAYGWRATENQEGTRKSENILVMANQKKK